MSRPNAKRWVLLAWFLAATVLFLVANRGAYRGYFSDDDLVNLSWPTYVGNDVYINGLLTPAYHISNFRPVGYLYYRLAHLAFHLNYTPYVAVLQVLHFINVLLLFFILRRLGFSSVASGAGAMFYVFHAAVLEVYWKPMYVFDLLCATLCLVTLLLYLRGHWILALVSFWLAYKSKEIAVMLPAALLAYEYLLGQRKWKRLIPYFVIALSFSVQALWVNRHLPPGHNYALFFTPHMLWHDIAFYSSALLFLPYAGLALLLLPMWIRDRRLYLGLILTAALLVPLLALPRRTDLVYWYVPLIGVAIMVAAVAARAPRWAVALFFVLWLPLNYAILREKRREILAVADENRWYTTGLIDYARRVPPLRAVVYDGIPSHVHQWGIEGAIHDVFGPQVNAVWYHDPQANDAIARAPMALVSYYPVQHSVQGLLRTTNSAEGLSYLRVGDSVPRSQFGSGWSDGKDAYRIVGHTADLALYRPERAIGFELVASAPAVPTTITVIENGRSLGDQTLSASKAAQPVRWNLRGGTSGVTYVTINSSESGTAVYAIGYISP